MGVGRGAVAPWIFIHGTDIVDRGIIVIFFGLFLLFFGIFSVPPPSWKRASPMEIFLPTPLGLAIQKKCKNVKSLNQLTSRVIPVSKTYFKNIGKGPSIKTSAVREEGVQCIHFADKRKEGLFRCRPQFFAQKTSEFFEIYGVSTRTRGVEPVRTFFGQGRSIFRDFMRTSFSDGP